MPEFVQEDLSPVKSIIVNFKTNEDMYKFSKLVGQLITAKTRWITYPEAQETPYNDKRWSDKNPKLKK